LNRRHALVTLLISLGGNSRRIGMDNGFHNISLSAYLISGCQINNVDVSLISTYGWQWENKVVWRHGPSISRAIFGLVCSLQFQTMPKWPCDFPACSSPAVRFLGNCELCNRLLCGHHLLPTNTFAPILAYTQTVISFANVTQRKSRRG